jgi:mono/diheme cytochrome c family protein
MRVTLARALICAAALVSACSGPTEAETASDVERGMRYDEDETFRRGALIASLENPDNGYARLRLERYRPGQWEALPIWAPAIRVVTQADIGASKPVLGFAALEVDAVPWAEAPLLELGRRAFYEYPVQVMAFAAQALNHPAAPEEYGLWRTEGQLGGLVWTALPRDAVSLSVTCSTCHASSGDDILVTGKNNAAIDIGRMASDFRGDAPNLAWGPGRLDVTNDGVDNPAAIVDLRPVRHQEHLQRAATVKNDLIALAIRTETLIITSLAETARPPRKLAFALALFMWRLPDAPLRAASEASARGASIFAQRCASCHQPPHYSGPPIALEVIGTDPLVGQSSERGTGAYRVPSLHAVGDRSPLFAAGSVRDLHELLDPSREATGHRYGLDLGSVQRQDLQQFLETL